MLGLREGREVLRWRITRPCVRRCESKLARAAVALRKFVDRLPDEVRGRHAETRGDRLYRCGCARFHAHPQDFFFRRADGLRSSTFVRHSKPSGTDNTANGGAMQAQKYTKITARCTCISH